MGAVSTEVVSIKTLSDETRERTPEEIRQEISNHRAAISDTINRLDDRIQEAVDWRTHVAEHPYLALGVAAGAGFLASSIFKRKASPQERIIEAIADGVEDVCFQTRNRFGDLLNAAAPRHSTVLQGALAAFITKAATNYLRGKMLNLFTSPRKPQTK